ncbi:MAG: AI-2E family transporter, partial [Patescibacteria group bacterium]|nr:AI-2E family transporter [Patescibacteria group bacterium]
MPKKIEISHRTIIFIAVFTAALWLLFQIREILLALFVSLILMSALNPSVKKLEEIKIPRWLAILIIYIIALVVVVFAIGGLIPPLIDQTTTLINQVPQYFEKFRVFGIDEKVIASQFSQFTAIPANIIKFIFGLFSDILALLGIAVITFYLLMERKNLDHYLSLLFGSEREKEINAVIDKIEVRLGSWVRSELLLMTFVGLLSYLGFRLIGLS